MMSHFIENVEWLAETGEHIEGACRRLGVKQDNLERLLYKAGRPELIATLKARLMPK